MSKSFKDHYVEATDKVKSRIQEPIVVEEIQEVEKIKPIKSKKIDENYTQVKVGTGISIMDNKTPSFSNEVIKNEIRGEVEANLTEEIESKVRLELTEKFENELNAFKQQLSESMICEMVKTMNNNNDLLLKVIETLTKKVEGLQESLNIELPTPIVNVTMPDRKVDRIVHRDSKGHITKITEQDGDE